MSQRQIYSEGESGQALPGHFLFHVSVTALGHSIEMVHFGDRPSVPVYSLVIYDKA
jgi:hypothetical protein